MHYRYSNSPISIFSLSDQMSDLIVTALSVLRKEPILALGTIVSRVDPGAMDLGNLILTEDKH